MLLVLGQHPRGTDKPPTCFQVGQSLTKQSYGVLPPWAHCLMHFTSMTCQIQNQQQPGASITRHGTSCLAQTRRGPQLVLAPAALLKALLVCPPLPIGAREWYLLSCEQAQLCCGHTLASEPSEHPRLWLDSHGMDAWSVLPLGCRLCPEPQAVAVSEAACAQPACLCKQRGILPPRD